MFKLFKGLKMIVNFVINNIINNSISNYLNKDTLYFYNKY